MYTKRQASTINSTPISDGGGASPFFNSPCPTPLSVVGPVAQQGSPPPTNKDSSLSHGCHLAAANTATNAGRKPTPRTANVSPQPRVFSVASLLNDPTPDQLPDTHTHQQKHVSSGTHHDLTIQGKAKQIWYHQKHPHSDYHHLDTVAPDPEDEMAPPQKPNSVQQRRSILTAPARLDSPLEFPVESPIGSQPATQHLTAAAAPLSARNQAERARHPQEPEGERQLPVDCQRGIDWKNDQTKKQDQDQDQDRRGDEIARETVTAIAKVISTTTSALSPTSATTEKKEFVTNPNSLVKYVEAKTSAQEQMIRLSPDDEYLRIDQDNADTRAHAHRDGALEKPVTLHSPMTEITSKANDSSPQSKAVTYKKEPTPAKKKTVLTPQKSTSKSSLKDKSAIRTLDKSEEGQPRNQDTIASAKGNEPDSAKQLCPVSHRNATSSPARKPPLTGIYLAYAATSRSSTLRGSTPRGTSPRGSKCSQNTRPLDGGPRPIARAVGRVRTTKAAETSRRSSRADASQRSEGRPPTFATRLRQQSADPTDDDADDSRSQTQPSPETSFRLVEPDDDVEMTSDEPDLPVAPEAIMHDALMAGIDDSKSSSEDVAHSENDGGHESIKDETKDIEMKHRAAPGETKPKFIEKMEEKPAKQEQPKTEQEEVEIEHNRGQIAEKPSGTKTEQDPVPGQAPKRRKIVSTKKSSTLPVSNTSPASSAAVDLVNGHPFVIENHRRSAGDRYEFQLEIKRPGNDEAYWDDEGHLFMESPKTVVMYWDAVPGGREQACEGMWKIYKIWEERKVGRKTKYNVGWIGSLARGWEWRSMLLANAKGILVNWDEKQAVKQAKKEAKEEGTDYEFDAELQQQAEQDDDDDDDDDAPLSKRRVAKKSRGALS